MDYSCTRRLQRQEECIATPKSSVSTRKIGESLGQKTIVLVTFNVDFSLYSRGHNPS